MNKRYLGIWFPYLKTDWFTKRNTALQYKPVVVFSVSRGRMVITAVNNIAAQKGIAVGQVLADAKAIVPNIHVEGDQPDFFDSLLKKFAEWFIRYSPLVAADAPDGVMIDATGCAHLWGGEQEYLDDITTRLKALGYTAKVCMAGTIGAAWAISRYGTQQIIPGGHEVTALSPLPPMALRIDALVCDKLHKLGLYETRLFLQMPAKVLRRRFGDHFILRLQQAMGYQNEAITPVVIASTFTERLYCFDPIVTRPGIEIAVKKVLDTLCERLKKEQKGIRTAVLKIFGIEGNTQQLEIGTNRATSDAVHIFKLFELKFETIAPGPGIELFVLEVPRFDEHIATQENMWSVEGSLDTPAVSLLLDRVANKIGEDTIRRYLPDAHYWPERSVKKATSLSQQPTIDWDTQKTRPVKILRKPEPITVAAPVPDYPPILFRHQGKVHKIMKADGPERIEPEWWLQEGLHRDYFYVEDEEGSRYWIYRSGHYHNEQPVEWFLHGYCA